MHPQVFHVELRQFPHQARAFNLSREELDARILEPWCSGAPIELQDRRWTSEKAKLTILEGPELRPDEIGLGRGWNNATRSGRDVTTKLLEEARDSRQAPADELKEAIVAACAGSAIALAQVVAVAAAREPQRRPSELLGAAEQARVGAPARRSTAAAAPRRRGASRAVAAGAVVVVELDRRRRDRRGDRLAQATA